MTSMPVAEANQAQNLVEITGNDYVEFYVGNAKQAAYFYQRAFGFSLVAYAGPETGRRDAASYVLQQGKIRFVLTTPMSADGFMPDHIRRHGDGVRDVAFTVVDVAKAYATAIANGGIAVPPTLLKREGPVEGTRVMREASRDVYEETGRTVGMKPAGGIRAAKQAVQYLVLLHETLGVEWLTPDLFRFGASTLLNDVLMQIRKEKTGRYQSGDYFTID
jgi:catechol 2,3-dioxygenase-like lactoylglutathione lyase family enzyme